MAKIITAASKSEIKMRAIDFRRASIEGGLLYDYDEDGSIGSMMNRIFDHIKDKEIIYIEQDSIFDVTSDLTFRSQLSYFTLVYGVGFLENKDLSRVISKIETIIKMKRKRSRSVNSKEFLRLSVMLMKMFNAKTKIVKNRQNESYRLTIKLA